MITIEIDNREPNSIKDVFNNRLKDISLKDISPKFNVILKNLEQGDFVIKNKHNEILAIFERKSINDLLSSVKDKRYTEQSERFLQLDIEPHKIYYIIEGNRNNLIDDSLEHKTFYSCLFSINYNKGFSVLLTNSISETTIILEQYLKRFIDNKHIIKNKNITEMFKKTTITRENINHIMLSNVPGIGIKTAKLILLNFDDDFVRLITEFKSNNNILNDVKINSRKINKTIIENIKTYLIK